MIHDDLQKGAVTYEYILYATFDDLVQELCLFCALIVISF